MIPEVDHLEKTPEIEEEDTTMIEAVEEVGTDETIEGGNHLPKTRVRIQLQQAHFSLPQGSPLTHRQCSVYRKPQQERHRLPTERTSRKVRQCL